MTAPRNPARGRSSARPRTTVPRDYDRASAERYWGDERRRLKDEFRIVLSAGEAPYVNAAYHVWETMSFVRALKPKRGMRVLDLACGLGRVSAPLALTGATVIGVDNAFAMVRQAAAKTARAAKSEGVRRAPATPRPTRASSPSPTARSTPCCASACSSTCRRGCRSARSPSACAC